jgi:hypothetical protein
MITVKFTNNVHGTVFQHITCGDVRPVQHNVSAFPVLEMLKDMKVDCCRGL